MENVVGTTAEERLYGGLVPNTFAPREHDRLLSELERLDAYFTGRGILEIRDRFLLENRNAQGASSIGFRFMLVFCVCVVIYFALVLNVELESSFLIAVLVASLGYVLYFFARPVSMDEVGINNRERFREIYDGAYCNFVGPRDIGRIPDVIAELKKEANSGKTYGEIVSSLYPAVSMDGFYEETYVPNNIVPKKDTMLMICEDCGMVYHDVFEEKLCFGCRKKRRGHNASWRDHDIGV